MKEIPLEVPGFEARNLKVIDKGIFRPKELYIDGKKVKMQRFKYIIVDNDGKEAEVKFNFGFLIDMGSTVTIKDLAFQIQKRLKWYEYLFGAWPIIMIFIGGAIGGALGAAAACFNMEIFRSKLNVFFKYLFTLIVSLLAVIIWLTLAVLIYQRGGFGK